MDIQTIDAALLAKMFLAGAKNLEAKKEWINELNVFPVPDGDTGTNMCMTIMSAAKEVAAVQPPVMKELAKAISSGSLRGARGNSGVILSQLFRGFTKVVTNYEELDKMIICEACQKAVETAYKAVMKPKEGTILTVAKGAADKALELACDDEYDLTAYIAAIIDEAERVLELTPEMLPILKQAGVVDSGGQGLLQVLKGCQDAFLGKEIDYTIEAVPSGSGVVKISAETEEEIKFGYCTEFIIVLNNPLTDAQVDDFREYLFGLGDSIVLVADDEIVKTHVHTNDPGLALQKALTYGSLSRIKIDNMREEHQEKLIKDAAKVAAEQEEAKKAAKESVPPKKYGFIAVSVGEGLNEAFLGLGVDHIITGGQTMNPSTEDILTAIENINAETIFIFPNNSNIIMAANQAASIAEDKEVIVVPTKTIPQGITAMINFVSEVDAQKNFDTMVEVIGTVKTGQFTYAVRDTEIDGIEIKENDFMGIGDNGIMASGPVLKDILEGSVAKLIDEESSFISVYYGADITAEKAEAFGAYLEETYPDCEVEIQFGGQPVYYYIVSVE